MSLFEQLTEAVENLEEVRARLFSAKAIRYDKPCVKSSCHGGLEDKIAELIEAENRVTRIRRQIENIATNIDEILR